MVMKTVQQFVQNVKWGELDVLLVDLPPGTGDAQLSLVQTLPLDGAIIVTTPQPAATQVALKGGLMFQKVNVPILGVAENMSYFVDPAGSEDTRSSARAAELRRPNGSARPSSARCPSSRRSARAATRGSRSS